MLLTFLEIVSAVSAPVVSTTAALVKNSSNTENSTTEASTTSTLASTTAAVVTNASNTENSTTEASTTSTLASTTAAVTTSASNTENSTTEASTTSTLASTTAAVATSASNTENSTTVASTIKVPSTTSKPDYCSPNPCGNGTSCLALSDKYVCQCPLNYAYSETTKACEAGKAFFGEFTMTVAVFDPKPESPEYTELYNRVLNESKNSLSNLPDYLGTNIISLIAKSNTRSRRSAGVEVAAKVSHMFTKGTAVTSENITDAMQKYNGNYTSQSICDGFYCDEETTICTATADGQGATCTCKAGHYASSAEHTVTSCRDCDPECYRNEGTYCNLGSKTAGECACLPGYKNTGKNECKKCDFGYSGVDCAENFQLVLVIVGVVLGVIIVALLGAMIGLSISSKKKKKYDDRTALIDEYEKTHAENSPTPARLFPRVQAKADLGQVNKAVNVYDDNEEFTRNIPKRDYDENQWYEMNRKSRNY